MNTNLCVIWVVSADVCVLCMSVIKGEEVVERGVQHRSSTQVRKVEQWKFHNRLTQGGAACAFNTRGKPTLLLYSAPRQAGKSSDMEASPER